MKDRASPLHPEVQLLSAGLDPRRAASITVQPNISAAKRQVGRE
jgi:hypothetical protein